MTDSTQSSRKPSKSEPSTSTTPLPSPMRPRLTSPLRSPSVHTSAHSHQTSAGSQHSTSGQSYTFHGPSFLEARRTSYDSESSSCSWGVATNPPPTRFSSICSSTCIASSTRSGSVTPSETWSTSANSQRSSSTIRSSNNHSTPRTSLHSASSQATFGREVRGSGWTRIGSSTDVQTTPGSIASYGPVDDSRSQSPFGTVGYPTDQSPPATYCELCKARIGRLREDTAELDQAMRSTQTDEPGR